MDGLLNRPVAFAFLVALLCLLPCTLLFISIDSGDSLLRAHLLRIPVVFWGWMGSAFRMGSSRYAQDFKGSLGEATMIH